VSAVPHLKSAPEAIVSFGQGCEANPCCRPPLSRSDSLMRGATGRGTINCNTNGSLPEKVKELSRAGLESIRVSLNSARPEYYNPYYRPRGYEFADLKRSIQLMKLTVDLLPSTTWYCRG